MKPARKSGRFSCAWRILPPSFGVTVPTAPAVHVWTKAGVWRRMHRAALDELGGQGLIDGSRAVIDAASVRANGHPRGFQAAAVSA
jgi:transposase